MFRIRLKQTHLIIQIPFRHKDEMIQIKFIDLQLPAVNMHADTGFSQNDFFCQSFPTFSYKTACNLNNQFFSVQTTKIPVLHYQILHIENIYKAQV